MELTLVNRRDGTRAPPTTPDRLQALSGPAWKYRMSQTWMWIVFNVFVLGMLAVDLGVFNRKADFEDYTFKTE